MPTRQELIASQNEVDEICRAIDADSLAYLSLEGLCSSVSGEAETFCTACWTGEYPVAISAEDKHQQELFPIRTEED